MTGAEVDMMVEASAAAEWEKQNAPDPAEKELKESAKSLEKALKQIDSGLDWIADAVSKLGDTPMADIVQSFLDEIEGLANGLESLKGMYERGHRG